jgi:predicted RNA methylase
MTLKHNKRKNCCIVYEQLLTLAARLATQKKSNEFDYVVSLTKRYYNPNTALGRERRGLQNLVEAQCSTLEDADVIVREALSELKLLSDQAIDEQKIALINEINLSLGADLFKVPIKNYKLYASAQILANEERNGYKHTLPNERMKIKKVLRENIARKIEKEPEPEIDNFTYQILVNKFNQKYGPFINEDQKKILSAWIKFLITEDKVVIQSVMNEQIAKIQSVIKTSLKDKNLKVSDYYELLKEADETLASKKNAEVDENLIYEVMRYFDLVEDLSKEDSK